MKNVPSISFYIFSETILMTSQNVTVGLCYSVSQNNTDDKIMCNGMNSQVQNCYSFPVGDILS